MSLSMSSLMPFSMASAISPTAIEPRAALLYLVAALCLSVIAGLRAYLPLLAVGVASTIPAANGAPLLPLRDGFAALGWPVVLATLALLAMVEFGADKSASLARISNTAQTVVRPLAGAIILAGTDNWLSQQMPLVAALLGALLALAVHGLKVAVRHAVDALSDGVDDMIASTAEDVLVVAVVLALLLSPLAGLVLLVVAGVVASRTLPRLWRRYRLLVGMRRDAASGPVLGAVAYAAPSMPAISQSLGALPASVARQADPWTVGYGMRMPSAASVSAYPLYAPIPAPIPAIPPLPRAGAPRSSAPYRSTRGAVPHGCPQSRGMPVAPGGADDARGLISRDMRSARAAYALPPLPMARRANPPSPPSRPVAPLSPAYGQTGRGWYDDSRMPARGETHAAYPGPYPTVYPTDAPTLPNLGA